MTTVFEAVAAVSAGIGAVGKDAQSGKGNDQWSFKYRGIEAVMNALHPLLAKHQVTIVPRCVHAEHEWMQKSERLTAVKYEYDIYGPEGDSFTGSLVAEGVGQRDKSAVIASSYAWRQFVCLLFSIPTEDMRDPEEDNSPVERREVISEGQLGSLVAVFDVLPEEARAGAKQEFVGSWGVPNQLAPSDYDGALRAARALVKAFRDDAGVTEDGEPAPEPVRGIMKAEAMAYQPAGWSEDQFIKWLCREVGRRHPDKDYRRWRDVQRVPGTVREVLESMPDFSEEPFPVDEPEEATTDA